MTPPCDRFEREALLELERGRPLDPHFATCADCRSAAERHRATADALRTLAQAEEPPAGWRDAVWERAARGAARPRWAPWIWAPVGLAAAAALVVALLPRPAVGPSSLAVEVLPHSGPARRASGASAGDRLSLRVPMRGRPYAELRLYRNETDLLLQCFDQPPCRRERDVLLAEVALGAMGRYEAVAVLSTRPIPRAGLGLDRDSAAALESGAAVYFGLEVTVE